MAEAILECKRKVDHTSSSESEADDGAEAEKHQRQEEENARKQQELEEEQRRLKKRIERKRKRSEEAASSSSSRHHPEAVYKNTRGVILNENGMFSMQKNGKSKDTNGFSSSNIHQNFSHRKTDKKSTVAWYIPKKRIILVKSTELREKWWSIVFCTLEKGVTRQRTL